MDIWKQLIIGTRTCQFCRIQSIKKGQACIHKKKEVVILLVVLQQLRTCLFVIINNELWTQKLVEFLNSNMKMLL